MRDRPGVTPLALPPNWTQAWVFGLGLRAMIKMLAAKTGRYRLVGMGNVKIEFTNQRERNSYGILGRNQQK